MTSRDGGATWRRADHVTVEGPVVSVAVDPWNPRVVYAATFGGRVIGGQAGVEPFN
jgi:hypothetical protein